MKSKNYIYSAPDFEVLEIELEGAVLNDSGHGSTEGRLNGGGNNWEDYEYYYENQ